MRVKEWDSIPPALLRCVQEVSTVTTKDGETNIKLKLHSKIQALELLGKNQGLFSADAQRDMESVMYVQCFGPTQILPDGSVREIGPGGVSEGEE